jgi:hypothetical protein
MRFGDRDSSLRSGADAPYGPGRAVIDAGDKIDGVKPVVDHGQALDETVPGFEHAGGGIVDAAHQPPSRA